MSTSLRPPAFIPHAPHPRSAFLRCAPSLHARGRAVRSCRKAWQCRVTGSGKSRAVLSIDVGTSATKAALCFIDQRGKLGPIARVPHETIAAGNLHVTQRLRDWFEAAIAAGGEALNGVDTEAEIVAIAVTGQMQDLIAVGPKPPSLLSTDAILYSDARAQPVAESLSMLCGTRIAATSILAKLTLLPAASSSTRSDYKLLLGAADYIIHAFAAAPKPTVTDATTVSTSGLTVAPHRSYNGDLLRLAGLSEFAKLLPEILTVPRVVGHLCRTVAERLGRAELCGVALVHGCGDAFSATAGACREEIGSGGYLYSGSSGWVGGTIARSMETKVDRQAGDDAGVFALGHAADETAEIRVGSLAAAGANMSFAAKCLVGAVSGAEEVGRLAGRAPVGANGVVYIPYIAGRRCPAPNEGASGALVGLRSSSTREDIARAVVEGVVFGYAAAGELLAEGMLAGEGGGDELLRIVGGGAGCESFVRGVAAVVARGGVVCGGVGAGAAVGVVGAGRVAAKVMDGAVEDWWDDGEVIEVGEAEREQWESTYVRWREWARDVDGRFL